MIDKVKEINWEKPIDVELSYRVMVEKINEIISYLNNNPNKMNRPQKLYAIENESTKDIIFSARGGAYQDLSAAENKAKLLHTQNPKTNYRVVEYTLSER